LVEERLDAVIRLDPKPINCDGFRTIRCLLSFVEKTSLTRADRD
jgi:hypothetical protein